VSPEQVLAAVQSAAGLTDVELYDPEALQEYSDKSAEAKVETDGLQIDRPDRAEAAAIRALQQRIWESEEDFLYPADIHSTAFTACSSLVCRADGQVAGFAFGFHKQGGSELAPAWAEHHQGRQRLESQLLGVAPGIRRRGLGSLLKRAQASDARRSGIDIINWTVDPLQFGNAILNFGQLRAVASGFTPDLYAFRNGLNQVAASRLEICWLINSSRVARPVSGGPGTTIPKLHDLPDVEQVNSGWEHTRLDCRSDVIAFEIPADWTALQASDVAAAQRWREATDRLFLHYLGLEHGRYLITGVAQEDERRFLIAHRVTGALLAELAAREG
jgi:predicted GNAT superfamily acetyltransferase